MSRSAGRSGRPARVDRDKIAAAAHEVGLEGLTMKAVADRLGVSVASLYYHVRGKEDLRRLAAEYSVARLQPPRERGQHWAVWLAEWAEYTRAAFASQPGLLDQFVSGALSGSRMAVHLEAAIGYLERQGFSLQEAMEAYELVSACALGAAVRQLRQANLARRAGRSSKDHLVWTVSSGGYERLERLAASRFAPSFPRELATVIAGIALRRGESADDVIAILEPSQSLSPHPGHGRTAVLHH